MRVASGSGYRKVGWAAIAVGLLLVLLGAWSSYCAARDLVHRLQSVQAMAAAGLTAVDPGTLDTALRHTRRDVVTLRQNVGWLAPAATKLGWLPRVGPVLAEAPALLELADTLSDVGLRLWQDAAPAVSLYQQGVPVQGLLPDLLPAIARDQAAKDALVARAQAAYDEISIEALPHQFQDQFEMLGTALPLLADGLDLAGVAPALLGMDRARTYLVLALNEDELRPGGGFISGVGQVQVAFGDIVSMAFVDSYAVDDFSLPYPDPPEPLRQFMGIDLWVFRDSNWSPDFPTAVRQALELYRPEIPVEVDGVIAIDQRAVQLFLDGLGPIQVAGVSEWVTGDTVADYMRAVWAPEDGSLDGEWWRQRKSFMGDFATAVIGRLEAGDLDILSLGRAVLSSLEQRHIQVYVKDAAAQALLAQRGWDGGLPDPSSDFLALAEANLGYNKVSTNVARSIDYEVDLRDSSPRVQAVVRYTHLSEHEQICKPEPRYDVVYEYMMNRCYWAHLRLFVPPGSTLQVATHNPIPAGQILSGEAWSGEAQIAATADFTVFSQALLLPTAGEISLSFSYTLPAGVVSDGPNGIRTYRLFLRKQAGVEELLGRVTLRVPENAVYLDSTHGLILDGNGVISYDLSSQTDVDIYVSYRVPEE